MDFHPGPHVSRSAQRESAAVFGAPDLMPMDRFMVRKVTTR